MNNFENFIQILKDNYEEGDEIHFYINNNNSEYNGRVIRIDIENYMYVYPKDVFENPYIQCYDLESCSINECFTDTDLAIFSYCAKNYKIINSAKDAKIATIKRYMESSEYDTFECSDNFGTRFDGYYFRVFDEFISFTQYVDDSFLSDDFGTIRKEFYFDNTVERNSSSSCYSLSDRELDLIIHSMKNNPIEIIIRRINNDSNIKTKEE